MRNAGTTAVSAAAAFSLTGAFLSALALAQHGQNAADCGAGDCSAVIASPWATLPPGADLNSGYGVPVALLGLMYFSGLAAWLWIACGRRPVSQATYRTAQAVTGAAAVVSVVYLGLMAVTGMWCPLCLAIHFVNFAMLPFVWSAIPEPNAEPAAPFGWQLTAAICLMLAASELAVWFGWDSFRLRGEHRALVAALAQSQGTVATTFRPETPQTLAEPPKTAADGLVLVAATAQPASTLEIYTDILCPSCRKFEEKLIKEYVPLFQGRLNVVLRHFPLCADCNPGKGTVHAWACEAAYLVEAARLQKGTETAVAVMHEIDPSRKVALSPEELQALAAKHGLDAERLLKDTKSDAVRSRVAADVKLGQAQQLNATPSLFLDGRPVESAMRNKPDFWQAAATRPDQGSPKVAGEAPKTTETAAGKLLVNDPQRERKLEVAKFMMEQYDLNFDSSLDMKEAGKVYQNATKIDHNGDGKIELEEIAFGIASFQDRDAAKNAASAKGEAPPKKAVEPARNSSVFPGDDFQLSGPTLDGKEFDLAQFKGKPVVVAYWASWCQSCVAETADLKWLYQNYHDQGLEFVGVSFDLKPEPATEFVTQNQLPWPQLYSADPEQRGKWSPWAVQANVRTLPTLFLIGADGKVADVHLRGRNLEVAVAKELKVDPTLEATATQEIAKLKKALVKPTNSEHTPDPLEVGDLVSVAGTTIDGGRFDSATLKGKTLLVAFWATWCPHCRKELPRLLDLHARYKDRGLEIVGVSLDRKGEDLQKFLGDQPLPWANIYLDQDGLRAFNSPLAYRFDVKGIPALFLIGPDGRLAAHKPRGPQVEEEIAKLLGAAPGAPGSAATGEPTAKVAPSADPASKSKPPAAAMEAESGNYLQLAKAVIKRYDTNQDSELNEEEWSKSKVDYGKFDTDVDGKLTIKEMATALELSQKFKDAMKKAKSKSEPAADGTETP